MTALQSLIGLTVSVLEEVHDYLQIVFSDGTTLSIFNNCLFDGDTVLGFEGKQVKSVEETDVSVLIVFEDGESISVGLTNDDYNGPEAMVLSREGVPPVVWN